MKSENIIYNIEIIIVFLVWFLILFSIVIQPLNLILGIICVLFLPGYNLVSLLRPKFNNIQRLGYSTVMSLAISNIFMFLSYIFLYDLFISERGVFIFDTVFLVSSIQIINIILILVLKFKNQNKEYEIINFNKLKKNINYNVLFFGSIYFISIILLSVSTFYNNIPNSDFSQNYNDYRDNYTFFLRVSFHFYICLIVSILSLTYIVFSSKNKYFILICIFIFLYTLWILPYLQIRNDFAADPHEYSGILKNYPKKGFKADQHNNFFVYLPEINDYTIWRYSTTIFTAIIFMEFTFMDVDFVLWFIYPLIYFSVPFFIYSTFEKYSKNSTPKNLNLIILSVLALFIGQFARSAHTATTGPIGTFIFLVLVIEFYEFIHEGSLKIKLKNSIVIVLIYFLLCLTHLEENIYFIILIIIYNICYLFFKKNNIKFIKFKILNKQLKRDLILNGFLIYVLLILFYISQEFFGYIPYYIRFGLLRNYPNLWFFEDFLYKMNITLPLLKGGFYINLLFVGAITFSVLIYLLGIYLLIFKLNSILVFILRVLFNFLKKTHNIIQVLFKNKIIQWTIFPFLFVLAFLIHLFYFQFLLEEGIFLIVELILNYTIIIFHIFLFLKGTNYYNKTNIKQNYFLLSILSTSSVMIVVFLTGDVLTTFYLLNARFLSFFIFFNLIIIQNTYFEDFMKKKKRYLIAFLITFLFLGTFFSLRKLATG